MRRATPARCRHPRKLALGELAHGNFRIPRGVAEPRVEGGSDAEVDLVHRAALPLFLRCSTSRLLWRAASFLRLSARISS